MKKVFPLDIYTIKKYGIEQWLSDSSWPITRKEYKSINRTIIKAFLNVQDSLPIKLQDAFYSIFSDFHSGLTLYIHHKVILERLSKSKIKYEFDKSVLNTGNLSSNIYWNHFIYNDVSLDLITREISSENFFRRVLIKINNIRKNQIINGLNYYKYINNENIIIGERHSQEMLDFKQNRKILRLPVDSFKYPDHKPGTKIIDSIDFFFKELILLDNKMINNINYNEMKNVLVLRLQKSYSCINFFEKYLEKYKKNFLYASALGNPLIRSFCLAANRLDIQTYGFTHGNYIGSQNSLAIQILLFGAVRNFVCTNNGALHLFKKGADKYTSVTNRDVSLVVNKNYGYFKKIFNSEKSKIFNSKIKKIMFVEVGIIDSHYYWPTYLDLTIKAAKVLKKNSDYYLILKKRNERSKDSKDVYENYFDEIINEPFEQVYDKADVLIFFEFTTTTLGFSLLTKKPIIGFTHSIKEHFDEYRNLLKDRCKIINSEINEKNMVDFDENELINAINNVKPPNYNLVEKFYID